MMRIRVDFNVFPALDGSGIGEKKSSPVSAECIEFSMNLGGNTDAYSP